MAITGAEQDVLNAASRVYRALERAFRPENPEGLADEILDASDALSAALDRREVERNV